MPRCKRKKATLVNLTVQPLQLIFVAAKYFASLWHRNFTAKISRHNFLLLFFWCVCCAESADVQHICCWQQFVCTEVLAFFNYMCVCECIITIQRDMR